MIAVLVIATLIGISVNIERNEWRRARYRRLAQFHGLQLRQQDNGPLVVTKYQANRQKWHARMSIKYENSSKMIWVLEIAYEPKPVRPPEADVWGIFPDPPEPE
jgi:hypothetical protein